MSAQHTPGRVRVQHPHAGDRGWEVAFEPGLEQLCQDISQANARRLVACWNACEGIEDPENVIPQLRRANDLVQQLEPLRIQRDELLEALRIAKTALVQWHVPGNRYAALDVINAAIAKVTGQEGGAA
jgi:hypothetical protein